MSAPDGQSFAGTVRQDAQWRSTPIVGLASSDYSDDSNIFDAVVWKFDRDELLSVVRSHLNQVARAA